MKLDLFKNKWLTVGLCSYEITAILTGRVPTITRLSRRYPVVGAALTAAIGFHFATWKDEK
jgi:uncharacterized membrane protein YuzA (DUF378 family)